MHNAISHGTISHGTIYKPTQFSMPPGAWYYVSASLDMGLDHEGTIDGAVNAAIWSATECWWDLAHGERRYPGDRDYKRPDAVFLLSSAQPRAAVRWLTRLYGSHSDRPMDAVSFGMTVAYARSRALLEGRG